MEDALKNTGGRPSIQEKHIFETREKIARVLIDREHWIKADVAKLFNLHPAQMTRLFKRIGREKK